MSAASISTDSFRRVRGIGLMVVGCGFITVNDAAMKLIVSEAPVTQAIFMRCAIVLATLVLLRRRRLLDGIVRDLFWKRQWLCAILLALSVTCFIASISYLPLAVAVTAVYTGPLFVVLLAPLLLHESLTRKKIFAVIGGFIGAVLVVTPTDGRLSVYIVLPLIGALLGAWRDIELRRLTSHATTHSILIVAQIAITSLFLLPAGVVWQPVSAKMWWLLLVAGFGFALGIYMTVESLRENDASFVVPYKYSGVIWSGLLGMFLWHDLPTIYQLMGAALVVGSGVYLSVKQSMRAA